jgi:hypothetical protein
MTDLLRKSGEVFLSYKETLITKRVPFTKDFERESVRLADTSGRTQRQCRDLVHLANIREQHGLCLDSDDRSHMTKELKALGSGWAASGRASDASD